MDAAFIVHLNIQDPTTVTNIAIDLEDDLLKAGHDVLSVAPWARPSTTQPSIFSTSTLGSLPPPPSEPPTPLI